MESSKVKESDIIFTEANKTQHTLNLMNNLNKIQFSKRKSLNVVFTKKKN